MDKEVLEQDMVELWAAWAELEWEGGNEDLCLQVLTMAAGMHRESIGKPYTEDWGIGRGLTDS